MDFTFLVILPILFTTILKKTNLKVLWNAGVQDHIVLLCESENCEQCDLINDINHCAATNQKRHETTN